MDVFEWLLEPENPSVRYRTLVELMGLAGSEDALEAKNAIPESDSVKKLEESMHSDGYWLQKGASGRSEKQVNRTNGSPYTACWPRNIEMSIGL